MADRVAIPRLDASFSAEIINRSITEAFVHLEYKNSTEDQNKAISEFVKGRDVSISLPTGEGKSLCYASLSVVFDNLRHHLEASEELPYSAWWDTV